MNRGVVTDRRFAASVIGLGRFELNGEAEMLSHPDRFKAKFFGEPRISSEVLAVSLP